jgi:hypothetical protein
MTGSSGNPIPVAERPKPRHGCLYCVLYVKAKWRSIKTNRQVWMKYKQDKRKYKKKKSRLRLFSPHTSRPALGTGVIPRGKAAGAWH